jgi:hypothetical protein
VLVAKKTIYKSKKICPVFTKEIKWTHINYYYYLKCLLSFCIIMFWPNHSGHITILYNKDNHLTNSYTISNLSPSFKLVNGRQNEVQCALLASSQGEPLLSKDRFHFSRESFAGLTLRFLGLIFQLQDEPF